MNELLIYFLYCSPCPHPKCLCSVHLRQASAASVLWFVTLNAFLLPWPPTVVYTLGCGRLAFGFLICVIYCFLLTSPQSS